MGNVQNEKGEIMKSMKRMFQNGFLVLALGSLVSCSQGGFLGEVQTTTQGYQNGAEDGGDSLYQEGPVDIPVTIAKMSVDSTQIETKTVEEALYLIGGAGAVEGGKEVVVSNVAKPENTLVVAVEENGSFEADVTELASGDDVFSVGIKDGEEVMVPAYVAVNKNGVSTSLLTFSEKINMMGVFGINEPEGTLTYSEEDESGFELKKVFLHGGEMSGLDLSSYAEKVHQLIYSRDGSFAVYTDENFNLHQYDLPTSTDKTLDEAPVINRHFVLCSDQTTVFEMDQDASGYGSLVKVDLTGEKEPSVIMADKDRMMQGASCHLGKLVFVSEKEGNFEVGLMEYTTDKNPTLIYSTKNKVEAPFMMPDGSGYVFSEDTKEEGKKIRLQKFGVDPIIDITVGFEDSYPVVTEDGKWVIHERSVDQHIQIGATSILAGKTVVLTSGLNHLRPVLSTDENLLLMLTETSQGLQIGIMNLDSVIK